MIGMALVAQANAQPYPDSDSSDGYDTGYYAEAYSGGYYNSAPAPTGESASRPIFPTQSYFELLGPMDSRNGRGSVDVQNWMTDLNLCRMSSGSWSFSSTAALRLSWFNGKGADEMDVDRLYTVWLNVNASYAIKGKTRLVFGVTPQISTDFDTWTSHNIFFGGHALLAGPLNDRFSYGIGIGCYPQLGDYPLLPLKVTNMAIWGNHSSTQYPDFTNARIGGGQFQGAVRRQRRMAEDIRHFLPVNGRNDEGMQAGDVEGGLAPFPAGLKSGKTQGRHHFPGIVGRMGLVMEEAQEMCLRMSV